MAAEGNSELPIPDLWIMKELFQPSLNGWGGPIAPIAIEATNFRLKNDMIQQVQNSCQFHGPPGDDANKHLDIFLHVTQSIKVNGVTDDALRLYLFPHSLTHHATAWFDRLPRNSINTFEQMAKMFLEKYFPPSMVTKLRNEITNFCQRPDESLFEAWERYKLSIDRCPNHNMLPVTQIDTFYNGLTLRHRDTINAAAGGTFMKRRQEECYDLIENMTAHHINPNCETCGGPHSFSDCPATVCNTQNVYAVEAYQVECETEATKDMIHPTNNGSTEDVQPLVIQSESPILTSEPVNSPIIERVASPVSAPRPNLRPLIPYPSRLQDQKLCDKANDQREKFFQIFKDLNFNISFADALTLMPKFGPSIKILLTNKDKLCELSRTPLNEHYSAVLQKKLPEKLGDLGKFLIPCDFLGMAECLALANLGASINLMPFSVWNKLSLPDLSPTCMTLDLVDRSISRSVGVAEDVFVKVGTFHFPADFVVIDFHADPRVPLIVGRSFLKTERALIDVFEGELTLREVLGFSDMIASVNPTPYYDLIVSTTSLTLTPFGNSDFHLEEVDAFLAIEDLSVEEKTALITVLKSHKRAIAWKLSDIKGIDPEFCTHKILMEEDFKPAVQHQRRVNPKIQDVIKQEGGFTVVENEGNELILTRLVTGWCVCIDYRKLNEAAHNDHFPLPFMDQMLERLARNQYYCFLDGFSGYFQIPIDLKGQEKTTFTCPYKTFAYRRIPFMLCNAPGTFQRYMMAIFHDMIEKTMKVFMDDFSVFENSFQSYFSYLEKMLKRCEDTNLCLNWEKSHFMVKEGIVLAIKFPNKGLRLKKPKLMSLPNYLIPQLSKVSEAF
nr:reverse transcriptase domain-containing protein [Tanacetum cinerariifolium]